MWPKNNLSFSIGSCSDFFWNNILRGPLEEAWLSHSTPWSHWQTMLAMLVFILGWWWFMIHTKEKEQSILTTTKTSGWSQVSNYLIISIFRNWRKIWNLLFRNARFFWVSGTAITLLQENVMPRTCVQKVTLDVASTM